MNIYWISWKVVKVLSRDKRTLGFFFGAPLLIMTLVYFALSEKDIPRIGVVSRGTSRLFEGEFIAALERDKDIIVTPHGINDGENDAQKIERQIKSSLKNDVLDGVIYLDAQLIKDRFLDKRGNIHLYLEGSKPTMTANVFSAISSAMDDMGASLPVVIDASCSSLCANSVNNLPMELKKHFIYGSEDYDQTDYFLPLFPCFFVFFFTFVLSNIAFQRERVQGTLARLLTAPVKFNEILFGYLGGFLIFALLQSTIVLTFILKLIQFPFSSIQLVSLIVVVLVTMVTALIMGLLVSFLSKNEFQALQFIPLVILPQLFLSDMFWNIKTFPLLFRGISYIMPLTHANTLSRDIMIKNQGLFHSWPNLLFLLLFPLVIFGVMKVAFEKYRRY